MLMLEIRKKGVEILVNRILNLYDSKIDVVGESRSANRHPS